MHAARAIVNGFKPTPRRCPIRAKKRFFREPPPLPDHRVNERIRLSPVRVIGTDGEQLGVIPIEEARAAARSQDLDLVEIAPDVRPPVCKIMDYGKFMFDRGKKARQAKQHQSQVEIKEVKLRPNIGDHDLETKLNRARQFLENGNHVRLTIMFRAREMRRPENGYRLLQRAQDFLDGSAQVAQAPPPTLQSRDLSMVLKPA